MYNCITIRRIESFGAHSELRPLRAAKRTTMHLIHVTIVLEAR